ncbi:MAG: NifB/NifX family molybdenum-iron cluster-binding protein [Eubacteriaceae bacterium]|jgi:nitrogen fixation protein NifX
MVKIAAASTDGKLVNQHFGKTDIFYILNADEESGSIELEEERHVVPVCSNGDHEDNRLTETIQQISDCQYVLVSRIGGRAGQKLERQGITACELPGIITESVDKLLRYTKVQRLLEQAVTKTGEEPS